MKKTIIINSLLTITFFVVAINFSGCATSAGKDFDMDLVRTIETGVTTKSEVLNLFGPPISKQIDQTGRENWSYTYSKHNVFSMHAPDAKSLLVSFVNDVVNICQVAYGGASAMNTVPCDKY